MYKLTATDHEILHAMETMVDAIATMFGEHTEVLLHALDENNPCVTKIANGHVTGRKVGAPITNIALIKLEQGYDISAPYITKSPNGKTLRSYTTIIRNSSNQPIGLICINSNLDAPFQEVMQALLPGIPKYHEGNITPEIFAKSNSDIMLDTIHIVRDKILNNGSIAPSKKIREIVTELFELGVFDIKDSAQITATALDSSVHTIYRYLRQLREEETTI